MWKVLSFYSKFPTYGTCPNVNALSFSHWSALCLLKEQTVLYRLGGWRFSFCFTIPKFKNQHLQSPLQTQASNIYNYKSLKAKPTVSFTYFISQFFNRNKSEGMHFSCLFSMNQEKKNQTFLLDLCVFLLFLNQNFHFDKSLTKFQFWFHPSHLFMELWDGIQDSLILYWRYDSKIWLTFSSTFYFFCFQKVT